MAYQATVIPIMIASPSDVNEEREIIRRVIFDWNCSHSKKEKKMLFPVSWETHMPPMSGDRSQALINEHLLSDCDLLIGVFWTRIGTPTGDFEGGSLEEIDRHLKAKKPAMIYFSSQKIDPDSIDHAQYEKLKKFKAKCQDQESSKILFGEFSDLHDFREKLFRDLATTINIYAASWDLTPPSNSMEANVEEFKEPLLSDEAKIMLKAASKGRGNIDLLEYLGGYHISAGDKQLFSGNDNRKISKLKSAIDKLKSGEFISDPAGKGELFMLTAEGYEMADLIPEEVLNTLDFQY